MFAFDSICQSGQMHCFLYIPESCAIHNEARPPTYRLTSTVFLLLLARLIRGTSGYRSGPNRVDCGRVSHRNGGLINKTAHYFQARLLQEEVMKRATVGAAAGARNATEFSEGCCANKQGGRTKNHRATLQALRAAIFRLLSVCVFTCVCVCESSTELQRT